MIRNLILIVSVVGVFSSCLYYFFCLWAAGQFSRERNLERDEVGKAFAPGISILKPLKGIDPEIYASFRSHCLQDYPEYEIIFGVSDSNDPAIESVKRLQAEFPQKNIQLVLCNKTVGANVKVSNLAQMLPLATYEHLIVNDSDIRVPPNYLDRVIQPLDNPAVGMVTCLYRGVAAPTLGSRLEALGIGTDFCPSVLVARQLEGGIRFGFGSTLAFRRTDLDKIGGFAPIADYLADDYELGKRIANQGLAVKLSELVVETYLPPYSLGGFIAHQLRWARGVRDARRSGYLGLAFTFGIFWALLALLASRAALWAWATLATTLLLRCAIALVVGKTILHDRQIAKNLWLIPLRDLLAVAIWIASLAGNTVTWRGERFRLENGKLTRIPPP
jgi:ceramide glucosyltransferase